MVTFFKYTLYLWPTALHADVSCIDWVLAHPVFFSICPVYHNHTKNTPVYEYEKRAKRIVLLLPQMEYLDSGMTRASQRYTLLKKRNHVICPVFLIEVIYVYRVFLKAIVKVRSVHCPFSLSSNLFLNLMFDVVNKLQIQLIPLIHFMIRSQIPSPSRRTPYCEVIITQQAYFTT